MSEIKPTTELAEFVNKTELEDATKLALIEAFEPFQLQAMEWKEKADAIKVTSIEDVKEMKDAREGRLLLQKVRTGLDKMRKTLKEDSLRKSQTIDAIAKQLTAIIEPIEESLREKEEFKDRFMAQMREELKAKRMDELKSVDVDGALFGLDILPEEQYQQLLENSRVAKLDREQKQREEEERLRLEAEQREKDRIERERLDAEAREAQRIENERLRAENEAKEAQLAKEREEAAAILAEERRIAAEKQAEQERLMAEERKRADEERRTEALKQEAIRKEQEKKLAEEREITAQLQREAQAKKDEEERLRQEEEARKESELAKGDEDKTNDLVADLKAMQTKYSFKSKGNKAMYEGVKTKLEEIINRIVS